MLIYPSIESFTSIHVYLMVTAELPPKKNWQKKREEALSQWEAIIPTMFAAYLTKNFIERRCEYVITWQLSGIGESDIIVYLIQ